MTLEQNFARTVLAKSRADRQIRDHFIDEIFNKTEIKIMHIKTAYNYNLLEIEDKLKT